MPPITMSSIRTFASCGSTCCARSATYKSGRIADGLRAMGVAPGTRLALLVPAGIDFVTLVFALLKSGAEETPQPARPGVRLRRALRSLLRRIRLL